MATITTTDLKKEYTALLTALDNVGYAVPSFYRGVVGLCIPKKGTQRVGRDFNHGSTVLIHASNTPQHWIYGQSLLHSIVDHMSRYTPVYLAVGVQKQRSRRWVDYVYFVDRRGSLAQASPADFIRLCHEQNVTQWTRIIESSKTIFFGL